jgi:putative ABC transport system ATP-binding protein/lipoprotein-releasing system ATP-binding protein
MIDIHDIWKIYDVGGEKIEALREISLKIDRGSFISIVGHSGSGKTTLLSILGGLTKPTRGSVSIDGTDIWSMNDKELSSLRNQKIGFIFQFSSLIPTLSAIDNVALPVIYGSREKRHNWKIVYEYAEELLSTLGLKHKLKAFPSELSGGQQRRVAIARAFINKPAIIVADEPTGDLDSQSESDVMEFFSKTNEQYQTTFLLVTHNLALARMTDKVHNMKDGMLIQPNNGGSPS